nr:MAG TPA: hypothetical protein [Bacteriophage sp.]
MDLQQHRLTSRHQNILHTSYNIYRHFQKYRTRF